MDLLRACISSQISIDKNSLESIISEFEIKDYKKNEFFLEAGKSCRELAFINSGYLRIYDIVDGKEITLWIASTGKFITSLSSFVFQKENNWYIKAVTDCTLFVIQRENHFKLCEQQRKWLEFDNLLLAHSYRLLEKSMFDQLHTTAQQRLETLLEEEPALFHHVPLQYIASMLGITPESLSRLRKAMTKPNS